MSIKGLIFDLDGVITDTARLHFKAWQTTLKGYGVEYSEAENELLKGLPRKDTLLAILKNKGIEWDDKKVDEACDAKNKLYVESLKSDLSKDDILPGITKLLEDAKAMELKMAIASSSKNASAILNQLGIISYFDYIVDVNTIQKGKPAPDIYLAAANGLGLQPEECIGFEDAFLGVIGLLSARVKTVSITNGTQEMYVNGTYICETTKDIDLVKIMHYFLGAEMICYEAIYHTAYGRYAYQNSTGEHLTVILRTKKDNISYVNVRVGDPFNWKKKDGLDGGVTQFGGNDSMYWEEESSIRMTKYLSDIHFDYFKAKIKTRTKRIRYAFEIVGVDGTKCLFGEKGFFPATDTIAHCGFTWGYLHKGNVSHIPDWVSKTIWYQIFPERYWNGDKSNDNPGTLEWGSADPAPDNYFGGDLQGVIDKLDHLTELGVTGIYFTPIFHANTNHKYDTEDYMEIDPHFGDQAKFKELIDKCHDRGIKVMIDAVFNHCGSRFAPWLDVVEKKENSRYKDWFFINDFNDLRPADQYEGSYLQEVSYVYETFGFVPTMPRLNWSNPEVKDYFKMVVQKWTSLGIDAWRLDVANEPPLNFWRAFRKWAKDINPDIYILGEVWYNSSLYLNGDTFDGVMNYTLRDCLLNAIKNNWSTLKTEQELGRYLLLYNNPIKRGMFNLLGSHDTPRILTEFEDDVDKYKIAYRLLFHMLGSVCIYYGDEIGMTGTQDPGCRKCMEWDQSKWNMDIYKTFQRLIEMRKEYPLLTNSEFKFVDSENKTEIFKEHRNKDVLTFKLYRNDDSLWCLVNLTDKPQKVDLSSSKWYDIFYKKNVPSTLIIKPYDMHTLKEN